MLFHRGQHAKITLHPSGVVIMDIGLNHPDKLTFAGKPSAAIAFPLQNAPEALHGTVVDAMRYAGHTLRHSRPHELIIEVFSDPHQPLLPLRLCLPLPLCIVSRFLLSLPVSVFPFPT